jgi:copper(I)-binding protein
MRQILPLLALISVVAACGSAEEPPVIVSNVEVTAPLPGSGMSAGYLEIRNNGRDTLTITRVDSPQFGRVAIHRTTLEDGVARMRPADAIAVPPGQTATLERGGTHLMLMSPAPDIDRVTLHLYAGDIRVVSVETEIGRSSD